MKYQPRIMYIEYKGDLFKGDALCGPARIGRVTFSKTGKTLNYQDKQFRSLKGSGYKANYYDIETRDHYWISGCKKNGEDRLYNGDIEIDEDVRKEYWVEIRNRPDLIDLSKFRGMGKYR